MKSQRIACVAAGLSLALTTVLGSAQVAYADPTTTYSEAVITKELTSAPGQELTEQFNFKFEAYNDTNHVFPALDEVSVTINTTDPAAVYKFDTAKAQIVYFANTDDLVKAISPKFAQAKTGIYEYKVTEIPGNNNSMSYDDNVYFLRVIKDQTGITTQVIKSDSTKTQPSDQKVDPTPNKDRNVTSKGEVSEKFKGSDFVFKNSYKLGTKAVLDKTLTVTKTVDGLDTAGTEYSFTVTFVTPDADNLASITAKGANGKEGAVQNNNGTFTFSLSRDQSVEFSNIQEGTLYSITESSKGDFTPSSSIVTGAKGLGSAKNVEGVKGNEAGYTVNIANSNATVVAGDNNSATITNTYTKVNPTGIIINNLPFVIMVGVPVAAAAWYVVSRRKAQN